MPGSYTPPRGRLLLAETDGSIAGCVALRPLAPGIGEVKRLYVVQEFRGHGIGRQLAEAIVAEARQAGYRALRLDTLERMAAANALYQGLGFQAIPAYYHNPLEGARFYELVLGPDSLPSPHRDRTDR